MWKRKQQWGRQFRVSKCICPKTRYQCQINVFNYIRIDTAPVTRLDTEVELVLLIESFTKIDAASFTRLNTNFESMISSVSFVRIYAASDTWLDFRSQTNFINCIIHKNRWIKGSWFLIYVPILRLDAMIVGDVFFR